MPCIIYWSLLLDDINILFKKFKVSLPLKKYFVKKTFETHNKPKYTNNSELIIINFTTYASSIHFFSFLSSYWNILKQIIDIMLFHPYI